MRRIKLVVAYDGTSYCGWQLQNNGVTIESVLNQALSDLFKEDIKVTGASRTDAGVHAFGNVAVFSTSGRMPAEKVAYALNQRLPDDVVVQSSEEVALSYHPRKCNSRKTYQYRILNRTFPLPIYRNTAYFYYGQLSVEQMEKACKYLLGEHDFKSFCSIKTHMEDTVRCLFDIHVEQEGDCILLRITGDGFLYNMVRIIAGTLIQVGIGKLAPEDIKEILKARNREAAGPTAPAKGLTLISIDYEDKLADCVEIKNENYHYQWIQKEIPSKEKAYFVVKNCVENDFDSLVKRMLLKSNRNGATQIYLTDLEGNRFIDKMEIGEYRLEQSHEMWRMEKDLTLLMGEDAVVSTSSLQWLPVEADGWNAFCQIYNQSFDDIPASATYDIEDMKKAAADSKWQQYFLQYEGEIIGLIELYDFGTELELSSLAIKTCFQGRGLGKIVLQNLIEHAWLSGKSMLSLTVCNQNKNAVYLYQQTGFQFKAVKSRWFLVKCEKSG